jgi:hypothetical protein
MFANLPRVLVSAFAGLAGVVGLVVLVALLLAEEKRPYELVKDLVLPLVGPVVAVMVPTLLLYVIPRNQSREKFAMDLCAQYYTEEMRNARNVGWEHFVTAQQRETPIRRAERLNAFLDYMTNPEAHRGIDPKTDEVYQKATRILDFFALVDACLYRGAADPDIVRSFLLYYYVWWRDEILDPLRKTRRIVPNGPKTTPPWWGPMAQLDKLVR